MSFMDPFPLDIFYGVDGLIAMEEDSLVSWILSWAWSAIYFLLYTGLYNFVAILDELSYETQLKIWTQIFYCNNISSWKISGYIGIHMHHS